MTIKKNSFYYFVTEQNYQKSIAINSIFKKVIKKNII